MKLSVRALPRTAVVWVALCSTLYAQDGPRSAVADNPMGVHTWFIILAVGAFLLWSVSYSLQLQREQQERQKGRDELRKRKDDLLDKIADLEIRREAGTVNDAVYRHEIKDLRRRLAFVLTQLKSPERQSKNASARP